jgi:hypothetical protein
LSVKSQQSSSSAHHFESPSANSESDMGGWVDRLSPSIGQSSDGVSTALLTNIRC